MKRLVAFIVLLIAGGGGAYYYYVYGKPVEKPTVMQAVISQGDIKVTITSENYASQPSFIGGFASDISSLVVTNTKLDVDQGSNDAAMSFPNTTVGSLIEGLARAKVDTRRMISILQAIKAAGALHAEIVVQ